MQKLRQIDTIPGSPWVGMRHDSLPIAAVTRLIANAQESLGRDPGLSCNLLIRAVSMLRTDGGLEQRDAAGNTAGYGKGRLADWQIRQIAAYIDVHLNTPIRVGTLAKVMGLSVSHFSRAFKQTTGMAPKEFIVRRRIVLACNAMLTTDNALITIAHRHGFYDQSHFTRAFQAEVGMAPNAWRHANRAN